MGINLKGSKLTNLRQKLVFGESDRVTFISTRKILKMLLYRKLHNNIPLNIFT